MLAAGEVPVAREALAPADHAIEVTVAELQARLHVEHHRMSGPRDASAAVANAHAWFEHHSGWAPPDEGTLAEWLADGVCRAPDDCLVRPDGWCRHGLASWKLVLEAL